MRPQKHLHNNRSGVDRFGYRPTPEKRVGTDMYNHQIGQTARQQLLDKIYYDRLTKSWQEENKQKGREKWSGFGNKELPIEKYKHEIMKMVASNRISLLAGETGSGKSTQLAQYALEMGYDHIVYLQPRRVTTDGIADRVDEELTEQFAQKGLEKPEHLVGMAHSERVTMHDDSIIQVMTSAVFKKRAPQLQESWKDKKVLIVADEVHEGNIETEFAVAMSAEMMTEQPNWNMVLMSATMNEQEIQQAYTPINGKPIPKIEVEGRPHEIECNEVPDKNVIDVFKDSCQDGNKTLIFTEGQRAMGAIENELRRQHPELRILKLRSKITEAERHAIFKTEVPGVHTVIISTSAGQSGLTIPGVDRVISDGKTKSPELDDENAAGLPSRLCSQAELIQQMGRGGRDIDGAKFFLANQLPFKKADRYTQPDTFVPLAEREEHAPADIYHTVITRNVLSTAAMERDFYNLNEYLIHSVSYDTIEEAYQILKMMGAVNKDNECTPIGTMMDRFPLRPELARALAEAIMGGTREQQRQVAAIAAAIEAGGLSFGNPDAIKQNHDHLPVWAKDDFLAELAYFNWLMAKENTQGDDTQMQTLATLYKLDYINVKRAKKQYKKVCSLLGIEDVDDEIIPDTDLSTESVNELKDMFVKGMPHLLYAYVGKRKYRARLKRMADGTKARPKPTVYYRNVLGPDKQKSYDYDRKISNRSALAGVAIANSDLIAGYPRWYYDDEDKLHNVIERGFSIGERQTQLALGSAALSVREHTIVGRDGRLRSVTTRSIGSLRMGKKEVNDIANTPDKATLLAKEALEKPGPAQRELRELKGITDDLAKRIPATHRNYFFEKTTLTHESLKELVYRAAEGASTIHQLDAKLRNSMYEKNIRLDAYILPENRDIIHTSMPDTLEINHWPYSVRYTDSNSATPYISEFPLESVHSLPDRVTIPDGERDVLFRYNYGDGDERYLTVAEVKQMARK